VNEVRGRFEAYEKALVANDIAGMNDWFRADERVVRFGVAEEQWVRTADSWRIIHAQVSHR
jgi:hypothetical protein